MRKAFDAPIGPAKAGPLLAIALLIASLIIAAATERYPLSAAHWDSPIYLIKAQKFAEVGYLEQLRARADEIHALLMATPPKSEGFWTFSRLGHVAILGTLVTAAGTDEQSIYVLTWAYRLIFAAGLFFAALFAVELTMVFSPAIPERALWFGALVTLLLYLLSPIASYMSGNLVSEVPAILLLSMGGWTLARSMRTRSSAFAICSGALAFLLYVVRMETISIYVLLLALVTWAAFSVRAERPRWWREPIAAALAAVSLFAVHSVVFFPLTDPRVLPRFVEAVAASHGPSAASTMTRETVVSIAGGVLWVGALLALPLVKSHRTALIGALWLAVLLAPTAMAFGKPSQAQSRMFTTFVPALFLLSTVGWAAFAATGSQGRPRKPALVAAALSVALVLIAQPASYALLRELPGMWRLQYVRAYLAPPAYEEVDYYLPELVQIRRYLEDIHEPFVLVASPGMQGGDHVMVVEYLCAPRSGGGGTMKPDGADLGGEGSRRLDVRLAAPQEDPSQLVKAVAPGTRILLLSFQRESDWSPSFACCGRLLTRSSTEHFLLTELSPRPSSAADRVPTPTTPAPR